MIEIKDLLFRWSNILLSKETKKGAIKEVIEKTVNLKIKTSDIEIKNNTVYLNIKPIYKNEIFIHQEEIISLLEESLGKTSPRNIR